MDIKALRGKSPEELRRLSRELHTHVQALRVQLATRQSAQTSKLGLLTRAIARIETLLAQASRQSA